jgi:hypothetical protein
LNKLPSPSKRDTETRVSEVPSTSQPVLVVVGNDTTSLYAAPSGNPASLVYSYGGKAVYSEFQTKMPKFI